MNTSPDEAPVGSDLLTSPESSSESELPYRLLLGVVGPIACIALVSLPILLTRPELPDRIAISWNSGEPNNHTSPGDFLGYNLAVGVVCAVLCVVAALKKLPNAMANATAGLVAGIIVPVFAVASLQISLSNRGNANWTEASSPSIWWMLATVLAAIAGAVAVAIPLRNLFKLSPIDASNEPSAGLTVADNQTASWHSQATAPWWRVVGIALLPLGLALVGAGFFFDADLAVVGLLIISLCPLFFVFTRIAVSIDRRGLTVRYGGLPWPKNHIGLNSITSAEAIHVKPMDHGGWGYRGSRKLIGRAAVVVRGGEGIRMALADGTDFIVTVDDAEHGAGVLNDLRAGVQSSQGESQGGRH